MITVNELSTTFRTTFFLLYTSSNAISMHLVLLMQKRFRPMCVGKINKLIKELIKHLH